MKKYVSVDVVNLKTMWFVMLGIVYSEYLKYKYKFAIVKAYMNDIAEI